MRETFYIIAQYGPWVLLAGLIVSEFVSWARNGCSLFWILGKFVYRKINSNADLVCVAIPQRCQYMIINEAIDVGAKIKIEREQPMVSDHEHLSLTLKESGLTVGDIYYVHKITRRNFYLSKNHPSGYQPPTESSAE